MCLTNVILLTFKEISDKIDAGLFDEVAIFPQIPDVTLCLRHSQQLQNTCIDIFPQINRVDYLKPSIYAIAFILLLRTCNIELYNTCTHVTDIWTAIRDEERNHIYYNADHATSLHRPDEHAKFWCMCSQRIETLFMCSANGNFIILGSTCITKTQIKSLLEKLKELKKILCDSCEMLKNPSSVDSNICLSCSKKSICDVCNLLTKPSKPNKKLCAPCYKYHHQCQSCIQYCSKNTINCTSCSNKIEHERQLKQIKLDEERRLRKIELDEEQRLSKIKLDEERRLRKIELDEERRLRKIELDEEQRLRKIKLDEEQRLSKIKQDEEQRLRKIKQDEERRLRNINIYDQNRLRIIQIQNNINQWNIDGLTKMECLDCKKNIDISTWSIRCMPCWKLIQ